MQHEQSAAGAGIRPMEASDRDAVATILRHVGNFTDEEQATALELIDLWLERGERSDYLTYVLDSGVGIEGYVCFGPVPLTQGTYDLYWIAVDRSKQRGGAGMRLMHFAESEVQRRGGRLLLIETSSQESYEGTIRFYERAGYEIVSRIRDFYKPGDDRLTFGKRLPSKSQP